MSFLDVPGVKNGAALDAAVTALATNPASALATAQNATYATPATVAASYVPFWKPSTAYTAGQRVTSPDGEVVTAKAAHTSGTEFTPTNWAGASLRTTPTTPDTNGSLVTYGHSFLAEQGLSDATGYHARLLASLLGLTYPTSPGGTANDLKRAVGGSRMEDIVGRIMGSTAPYVAGTKSLVLMQCLINSSRLYGNDATAITSATNALRSALATISASSRVEETDAAFTFNNSFTSATSNYASGGNWKFHTVQNTSFNIVTPAGPAYIILTGKQGAGPTIAVTDVTNAGAAVATLDLSNQTTPSPSTPASVAYAYKVPTALQGHTLRFTKTDAGSSSITVDVMLPQDPNPPRVVLLKEPYLADYSLSVAFPNGSDAATDAFNAIIDAMAVEFPNVIVADPNQPGYWDKTKHISSDGVHPNAAGHAALARATAAAVMAATVRTAISGQAKTPVDSSALALLAPLASPALTGTPTINGTAIGSGHPQVDIYTASGSYTPPAGATAVTVICVGGGGGGGAGRQGAAATVRTGGGGGGGGARTARTFSVASLTSPVTVTVGTGGAGGTAQASADSDGAAGSTGITSSFGPDMRSGGGAGGPGGSATSAAGGAGGTGAEFGSIGGVSSSTGAAGGAGGSSVAGAGGGGGGGITTGNVASVGGAGGSASSASATQAAVGVVDGTAPTAGGSRPTNSGLPGSGGAGGSSSITTAAQTGATGGLYGGGGGGGGASLNGSASGAGGAGRNGIVIVVAH